MRKQDELRISNSCLNKARIDEWLFVLLERDCAAAATVNFWINERIRLGKNQIDDPQIQEAIAWIKAVSPNVELHNFSKRNEEISTLVLACLELGSWMSAVIDDEHACKALRQAAANFINALGPFMPPEPVT